MPRVVADIAALATHEILDRLRKGSIDPNVGPLENLLPIGLGHSAGALLIVVQQARSRCYDALVLLGFSGEGLIDFLTEDERRYVNDPARLRSALTALTKERFGGPLPTRPSSDSSSSLLVHGVPPETAMEAIREATSPLLGLVGLTSMVPGSIREELETIDAPVFLGVGEFDITGRAHRIPEELPTSRDITMFVLPDAGHNHNVADTRELLWGRTARWIQAL
jgi:pimeloyl-ACP methyl ester carboxylesterase